MFSALLVIIYVAFISLGLPDSLLGSAWPVMYGTFHVPVSYAGIIGIIISGGTILSALFCDRLIQKLGTGMVTAISVAMTAIALFGFSISGSFWMLCVFAVPYGLGAGSVDSALNNYVALHFEAKHMSWLHCFWGIGATLGPYIMGLCLTGGSQGYRQGYQVISTIQILLAAVLFLSLPLWKKQKSVEVETEKLIQVVSKKELLRMKGMKPFLTAFFCYCAMEITAGMWAGSYLVLGRGISGQQAAKWVSGFYLGITAGRLIAGFMTLRFSDRQMIRIGQSVALIGMVLLLAGGANILALSGLIILGFGCAPIYPSVIHQTPQLFGKSVSQSIIGMQMASAYLGSTLIPPIFGLLAEKVSVSLLPVFLLFHLILMILLIEKVNHGMPVLKTQE